MIYPFHRWVFRIWAPDQLAASFQRWFLSVLIFTPNVFWTFISLHKKARTDFETLQNWLRLLTPPFEPILPESLSLAQSARYHDLFHYTENLQLWPPFKRVKAFLGGGKKKKKNGFFANQTWGHFCVWPSEPPMDFVDLLHPQNSWVCGDWTLKLWKTVLFCLVFFPLTERLLMCQRKGSTFVLCKSSHVFRFWDLLWRLTSVHSTSDKNGLTA